MWIIVLYHFSKGNLTPFNQFWDKIWDMPNKKTKFKKLNAVCIQYYSYSSMHF
jgi:hypothetical protein